MFLEQLSHLGNRIEGTLALSLIDADGIAIESFNTRPDLDLELLSAELVTLLRSMEEGYQEVEPGPLRICTVATDELTLMVSSVAPGFYLLLVLARECNLGKARFELKRARLTLEEELSWAAPSHDHLS